MTLCDGERGSLPVSSLTFDITSSKTPPTICDLRLSLETQKGLSLNLASEDPAIDSGLKAVSLLE